MCGSGDIQSVKVGPGCSITNGAEAVAAAAAEHRLTICVCVCCRCPAGSVSATSVAGPGGAQTSTTQGGQTTGFQTTGQQTTGGMMGVGAGMPTGASVSAAAAAFRRPVSCACTASPLLMSPGSATCGCAMLTHMPPHLPCLLVPAFLHHAGCQLQHSLCHLRSRLFLCLCCVWRRPADDPAGRRGFCRQASRRAEHASLTAFVPTNRPARLPASKAPAMCVLATQAEPLRCHLTASCSRRRHPCGRRWPQPGHRRLRGVSGSCL